MWLIVAGGFKNSPALRLYLAHGFAVISMLGTTVIMSLCNVDDESARKSLKQLVSKLESTFLLPHLKQSTHDQTQRTTTVSDLNSQEDDTGGMQDPSSQGSAKSVGQGKENQEDSTHSTVLASEGIELPSDQESNESNVNIFYNSFGCTRMHFHVLRPAPSTPHNNIDHSIWISIDYVRSQFLPLITIISFPGLLKTNLLTSFQLACHVIGLKSTAPALQGSGFKSQQA